MKGAEELDRELSSQKEKSIDQTYDDYSDNEVRVCFSGISFSFIRPFCVICYCYWSQKPTDRLALYLTTLFVRHMKVTYYTNSQGLRQLLYLDARHLLFVCSYPHMHTCQKKSTGGTRFTKRANMA
jgi:hypothetical protein